MRFDVELNYLVMKFQGKTFWQIPFLATHRDERLITNANDISLGEEKMKNVFGSFSLRCAESMSADEIFCLL